jgi:galactokinase
MDERILAYIAGLDAGPEKFTVNLRSPGRINVIGEHTDYTGGLVMPAAIDRAIYFAARPLPQPEWRLHAIDINQTATLPLPVTERTQRTWVNYLAGIGVQYQDRGHLLPGMEIVLGGDLPVGSGMSSSAALEGGMAFLLNEVLNTQLDRPELARLCQRSSNTFMGIPSGIMDQFASLNGLASGPIVLNCATHAFEPVKNALNGYSFILVNSMVSHDLSDGAYTRRVEECELALSALRRSYPELPNLSAAKLSQLERVKSDISSVVYRRARYVIGENERVRAAIQALEGGAASELGRLLSETHRGLRDEYEVSCTELDYLQRYATSHPAVSGARLMGGGFGGCTLNLVADEGIDSFTEGVLSAYEEQFNMKAEVYPVRIREGTSLLPADR